MESRMSCDCADIGMRAGDVKSTSTVSKLVNLKFSGIWCEVIGNIAWSRTFNNRNEAFDVISLMLADTFLSLV